MKNLYDYFIEMLNHDDDKLILIKDLVVGDHYEWYKNFWTKGERKPIDVAEYLEQLSGCVEHQSYQYIVHVHKGFIKAIYGDKLEEILLYIKNYKGLDKIKKLENKINHLTKILNETKKKYGIK